MNDGIPAPFSGCSAMTAPALAVLALRFDGDVLPARVERLDGALSAYCISAVAGNPNRRASCRHGSVDGPGQCDPGGVDPRPTGAMALGAPTLAGLAATISVAKRHSGATETTRSSPDRAPILLAMVGAHSLDFG